jgi:RNA polymerase sigma factor for flagellar operon FliA
MSAETDLDLAERDQRINANVGLVKAMAYRLLQRLPAEVELDDLIGVGVLGLIEAASRYKPTLGVPFEAFARRRIHGAMLDSLRELDWAPRSLRKQARAFEASISRLRQELAREPEEEEIAAAMNLSPEECAQALEQVRGLELCSLRRLDAPGESGTSMLDLCLDPGEGPEERVQRSELKQRLAAALGDLPERERQILALYYDQELTMAEIGLVFGVSESRISQLRSLALRRLRASLSESLAGRQAPACESERRSA